MKHIRVLMADDHTLVLEGFKAILDPLFNVVGVVQDGRALLREAPQLQPHIVLIDISMPLLSGLDAIPQLRATCPDAKLIMVTMHENPNYVAEAFRLGVSGYLLKFSARSELIHAIQEVVKGRSYLTPLVTKELLQSVISPTAKAQASMLRPTLTPRQREVLQLVVEGHPTKKIADMLCVSIRTIQFHKSQLMTGLGVRTTAKLIRYSIDHQLVVF